ncbi:MAG: long-chain-acyl-CoA synthetase [Hyphomicrobiales bacterium]|nr:long-chain-acyl-CoA synthetase [Hyphomicrobiales bacterium]
MNSESATGAPALQGWLRALQLTKPIATEPTRVLPVMIDELAERFGAAPALLSERETLTYRGLAARANRYARWALGQRIAKGDVVCLLMPSRPDYLAFWLGVTRVGGVVALLNEHLRGISLAHCIDVVRPTHVVVAAELADAFESARRHLSSGPVVWLHGDGERPWPRIDRAVDLLPAGRLGECERRPLTVEDPALLIYTSGTTGLPKAAKVDHHRLLTWSLWFAGMMGTGSDDRMYNCLPMYHSVGGVVAVGAVLVNGGSVVIRERFSATRFWDDVVRLECTLFQYIGELCRYLAHAPAHPRERQHRLRLACGNGLRPEVWERFQERFAVPRILEFYASTEGNVTLFNYEGKPGAIGRIPSFLAHRSPTALVRQDPVTGEPARDANGRCIRCRPDEIGEAIGRIRGIGGAGSRFQGYTDAEDTERKILRDVLEPGDAWFRTGDLMRKDAAGYFYFVDRIGDTFRWKGENVSTSEVAETIAAFAGVVDVSVYGVAVPGRDGRAGMAALVTAGPFDLPAFHDHLATHLPDYAQPLFLRLTTEIATTTTFKHKKAELAAAGYDPASACGDALYVRDQRQRAFVVLDDTLHQRLLAGELRP